MSKRKPNNELMLVHTEWPVFSWCECESCKMEFRRVKMYRMIDMPYIGGVGTWKFICSECAKTKQEAFDLFEKHVQLSPQNKPKRTAQELPPPPPPPRLLTDDVIRGDVNIKITPTRIPPPPPSRPGARVHRDWRHQNDHRLNIHNRK